MPMDQPIRLLRPKAEDQIELKVLPPLSLYIHIPWCVRKCPYCDFNSHEAKGDLPEADYLDALVADLDQALPLVWGRNVHTVFFGGGTPSLFSPEAVDRLLAAIRARLPLRPLAEITLEANPGTVEAAKFRGFRQAGVTRVSLGIQSFNPEHLKALGRIHDDREARAAVDLALEHFDNVNLDLMYGLPGQTAEQAEADIAAAVAAGPRHVSWYHLTLEPHTPFYRHPPALPAEDLMAEIEQRGRAALQAGGYERYEVSAYAQPGAECRHNLNYWRFGDYLGIGAGAHGKLSFHDRVLRQARHRGPPKYMEAALAGHPMARETPVPSAELGFEFMMNALRLARGFPAPLFEERTGLPLLTMARQLDEAKARGLLTRDAERLRPTERGLLFLNDLLGVFLPDRAASFV